MKLTTRTITEAFANHKSGKPLIVYVFDSISDFKRKIELLPIFKQITEVHNAFTEERALIINRLIEEYCSEKGLNKNNLKGKPYPLEVQESFVSEIKKVLDTEIEIETFLFTRDEIEKAEITISEIQNIINFIKL